MDKLAIALFADILYHKGIIKSEELNALYDLRTPKDLTTFTDKLLRGDFDVYKRGEHYEYHNK